MVPSAVARIRQDLLLSIIVLEPKLRESNLESLDPFDVFFHCLGVKEVAAGVMTSVARISAVAVALRVSYSLPRRSSSRLIVKNLMMFVAL